MSWLFGQFKSHKQESSPSSQTGHDGQSGALPGRDLTSDEGAAAPAPSPTNFPMPPTAYSSQEAFAALSEPSRLHPLAGLDKPLDYLLLEDEQLASVPGGKTFLPSRGWSDDLCYGTGTTYLLGLATGGAYGLAEGLQNTRFTNSNKLRLNGVLNAVTRRGPFLGNSAAVVAIMYNGINSTLDYYRGRHDWVNSVSAGAASGAIFKSTRGIKSMAIASTLAGSAAAGWCLLKKALL